MEVIVNINNVPCRVLNWGDPFSCDDSDVILCITGNPGIIDFYYEFSSALHERTGLPVCLVGQAGHEIIPNAEPMELKSDKHLFDLEGQTEHKLDLINKFINKQSKLHLVGHSIGAWFIIKSVHKNPLLVQRISSINLLFPTLMAMAATKNGKYVNNILRRFQTLILILLTLLNMLPNIILNLMAMAYLKLNGLPQCYIRRVLKYIDQNIVEKVLFLAFHEMDQVIELDVDAIDKVKHLVNVIYSENDGWVPLNYIEQLKQFQPAIKLKQVPIPHEFVIRSSETVAEMVSDFIEEKKNMKLNTRGDKQA